MLNRVMVTLDGSELAEQALEHACRIIAPGGTLLLLTVVNVPDLLIYGLYPVPVTLQDDTYEKNIADAREQALGYLLNQRESLEAQGFHTSIEVRLGDPAETIVERAQQQKVDVIVISTHGRTGVGRWVFGSVAQKVLQALPCPVLVVPGRRQLELAARAEETVEQA